MLLSIGMIVKNEEKTLDACLASLKNLRTNVECELIIADTGSTDATKEIATKYADILFDFEWCDDFSAARNSTLDHASGEWFMFLDGDEIFEDTLDIEEFFLSGEYLQYRNASYIVRNYGSLDHSVYSDFHACRIYQRTPSCRFSGKIHESISFYPPVRHLCSYVHHESYLVIDPKKRDAKKERNTTLIKKELEENPNDIRMIAMMAQEYGGGNREDTQQELEYCNRGIRLIQDNLRAALKQIKYSFKIYPSQISLFYYQLYCMKTDCYVRLGNWEELIETGKEYFAGKPSENLSDLTIYYNLCNAYDHLDKWENALEMGQKFIALFENTINSGFTTDDALTNGHILNSTDKYHSILKDCLRFCVNLEKYSSVFCYLEKIPIKEVNLSIIFYGLDKTKDPLFLIDFYDYLKYGDVPEKLEEFFSTAEHFIFHSDIEKKLIIHAIASLKQDDSIHYILLNKMRYYYLLGNVEAAREILSQLKKVQPFHRLLSDVIYYSLKEKQDLSVLFESIRVEELVYYIQDIRANHSDFQDLILEYFSQYYSSYQNSVKAFHWSVYLLESAILMLKDINGQEAKILTLLNWYIETIILYTHAIYHPDLLLNDRVTALPAPARFAYYVEEAKSADQAGDELGYYRNMTQAIDQYKVMAKPMKLLINHHREEQENKKKQLLQDNQELMELADQVKKQLYMLAEQKNYSAAKEVLYSYDKIIPNDPDLSCIREIIQSDGSLSLSTVPS